MEIQAQEAPELPTFVRSFRRAIRIRPGSIPSCFAFPRTHEALPTLSALKHGTELRVRHAQHIHREEISVDPGVQNVWTHDVCRGAVMMSLNIFKNVRIALCEEKKR